MFFYLQKYAMNAINIYLIGLVMLTGISYAGGELTVELNTGDEFKWQFNDVQEASEFLADRVESGRCNPNIVNIRIKSKFIDGLDEPNNKFGWYHGVSERG